jgi:hypothetical protein
MRVRCQFPTTCVWKTLDIKEMQQFSHTFIINHRSTFRQMWKQRTNAPFFFFSFPTTTW